MRSSLAGLCLIPALTLAAQSPDLLSLDSIYHPTRKVAYFSNHPTRLQWTPDGALVEAKVEKGSASLWRVDPRTWEKKPLLDADRLRASLVAAGAKEEAASAALGKAQFTWREDRGALVLSVGDDLYLVDLKAGTANRLTNVPGSEDEATFSPDGSKVAFLRGNDLYAVDTATARETRLTTGGDETHFNGRLDWVYQEEVYGRGHFKAFWWSPDSKRLAFLSLDETKVPVYTLPDDRPFEQKLERARYPKAGDPNPIARLGLVDLDGRTTWMTDPYAGQETLLVQVGWTPAGKLLAAYQDRVQTWLDLRAFEGSGSTSLVREQSKAWQERLPLPLWLPDGGFIWESDRSGFHHLYRYGKDGRLLGAVTRGEWDVKAVHGFDPKSKRVFFDATERGPLGLDAYATSLDGKLTLLTGRPGTHHVRFNKDFSLFLDTWSDIRTAPQQSLHETSGKE
ncbi:MAG TPA: DPP IV N-terminal domain-containing protein, partial [Holophagaceae bacterium]|nr:DPP IV N-terminal domain-containing protein [Holophagaceae bacterium]